MPNTAPNSASPSPPPCRLEAEKIEPSIHDLSLLVELLVRADRMSEAVNLTTDMLGRSTFPQPRVFKFLMSRLSADGDVDGITAVGAHLKDVSG